MNNRNKIILHIFIFIVAIILALGFYKFFILGQKDFGLRYHYYYCENGVYYKSQRGVVDGSLSYYDKTGNFMMNCPSWGILEGKCKEAYESAGNCIKK